MKKLIACSLSILMGAVFSPIFNSSAYSRSNGGQDNANPTLTAGSGISITHTGNNFTFINTAPGTVGTVPISSGGTGQTTSNAAINALLVPQTGHNGQFLQTDGVNTSWATTGGGGLTPLTSNQSAPTWTDSSHLSISNMAVYDSSGSFALTSGVHTIHTTAGNTDGIAQSQAPLTGTVATSNVTTTVTGTGTHFTTEYIIGDTIYIGGGAAQAYKVIAIGSDTSLTISRNCDAITSGLPNIRGGLATDTAYYLYAIAQSTGASPAYMLSTRSISNGDTLVDLPVGYTLFRQVPFDEITDDATGSMTGTKAGFYNFHVTEWSPSGGSSKITWNTNVDPANNSTDGLTFTNLLRQQNNANAVFNPLSTNAPKNVQTIESLLIGRSDASVSTSNIKLTDNVNGQGTAGNRGITFTFGPQINIAQGLTSPWTVTTPLDSSQILWYRTSSSAVIISIGVLAYYVTGVK